MEHASQPSHARGRRLCNVRLPGCGDSSQASDQRWRLSLDAHGRITALEPIPPGSSAAGDDWGGDWLSPMGVDLQINGGLGLAFPELTPADQPRLVQLLERLWADGVEAISPTLVTCGVTPLRQALAVLREVRAEHRPGRCRLLGAHLEGPFLAPERRGAHPAEHLAAPSLAALEQRIGGFLGPAELVEPGAGRPRATALGAPPHDSPDQPGEESWPQESSDFAGDGTPAPSEADAHQRQDHEQGRSPAWPAGVLQADLALVTLAPELPGALEVIAELRRRGVVVSLGHSAASEAQAEAGFAAGVSMLTHVLNAMPDMHRRAPGPAAAALLRGDVHLGLIADGVHVAPTMAVLLQRLAPERVVIVSDALAPYGLADGIHRWDERELHVSGGSCRLADGTLAGVTLPLLEGAVRLAAWSGRPDQAIAAATVLPRRVLGEMRPIEKLLLGRSLNACLRWRQEPEGLRWSRAAEA